MKSFRGIVVLIVVAACVAFAGVALASKGYPKPARQVPHSTKVQQAEPLAKAAHVSSKSGQSAGDTDNVQSGDQTTPDQADEQSSESSSESSGDNEAGQAGEPADGQGHQDPPGDVNHECTDNCQE